MAARSTLGCRVGFAGGTAVSTIDEARVGAQWSADHGFDSYWLSFVVGVDPLVAFAAIGSVGDLELGTSVIPQTGRHPIALAQMARTAQQATDGHVTLGIGPSHQIVAEGMYGEPWSRPAARTAEYLEALTALCAGEPAQLNGDQITAHATLNVPAEPVPVILAALGPRMLELAGRLTSGTHVGQTGPKTIADHTAPTIRAAAAAAGRPEPRIIALVNLCVSDDPAKVRDFARPHADGYASLPSYRAMLDREGIDDATELVLAGSIDEIHDGLAAYVDAGATDLRIGVLAPDQAHRDRTMGELEDWMNR